MVNKITNSAGEGIVLKGNNIDTDRIIPARFLKELTFEKLGKSAFIDDRQQLKNKGQLHPLDDPKFKDGSILIVNTNFGCGSSREAAPQALHRFGIKAIIGVSFGDIFFSSSVAIGMPCVQVSEQDSETIQSIIEENNKVNIAIDIAESVINVGGKHKFNCRIDEGVKKQFLNGTWDALYDLGQYNQKIEELHQSLPYISWRISANA